MFLLRYEQIPISCLWIRLCGDLKTNKYQSCDMLIQPSNIRHQTNQQTNPKQPRWSEALSILYVSVSGYLCCNGKETFIVRSVAFFYS